LKTYLKIAHTHILLIFSYHQYFFYCIEIVILIPCPIHFFFLEFNISVNYSCIISFVHHNLQEKMKVKKRKLKSCLKIIVGNKWPVKIFF